MGTEIDRARREDTIGFEDWAALSARLLRRTDAERARILGEARLTPEEWTKLDVRFARELLADLAERDLARAHRYGAICAEELAARGEPTHDTGRPPPMPPPADRVSHTQDTDPPPPPLAHAAPIAPLHDTDRPPPTPRFQEYLASAPPAHHDGKTLMLPQYGPPPVDRTPELTVDQYAALCVASAMFPDRALAVLHQFGVLDEAAHRELNEEWRAKMGHDSDLQARWIKLCEHYRDYYGRWPQAQR